MKIVVSVMPRSLEDIQSLDMSKFEGVDIIEWRADGLSKGDILRFAPAIFEKFSGREVIFTLRTRREGGFIELTDQEYVGLIKDVNALYQPEYIDFEYFSYQDVFKEMLKFPNLVLSYHNAEETPENLMEIFSELTALSPRIVRIGVKSQVEQDVLDLMNYTRGFKTLNPQQDYATLSLGKLGRTARLMGETSGSCWAFASLRQESPSEGLGLTEMRHILSILEGDKIQETPE